MPGSFAPKTRLQDSIEVLNFFDNKIIFTTLAALGESLHALRHSSKKLQKVKLRPATL